MSAVLLVIIFVLMMLTGQALAYLIIWLEEKHHILENLLKKENRHDRTDSK